MELSGLFMVEEVLKKTKAEFFKDLAAGDTFEMMYNLNGWYHNAPSVDIKVNGEYKHCNTANQLRNNLRNFKIKQVR